MKRITSVSLALGFAVLVLVAGTTERATAAEQKFITIGTGGVTGVYYSVGGAICRFVNKGRKEHGVRCSVEATGGSVYNVDTIRAGELDMGVAQSDWQYHAYNGTANFEDQGPFKELRAVFSVHPEPVNIVARKDADIKHISDLVNKRVNIGNPGSGTEATWNLLWGAMGHVNSDLKLAAQLKSAQTPDALCDDKIDAFFWLAGMPNGLNKEAASTCETVFAEVTGPAVDKILKENPYYFHATIPGGMYKGNPNDIKTFGVGATLVSSTATSPERVYLVVKSVFDNFDAFRELHPAFANLKESEMMANGLTAPLHEGALRYYKERGWK